MNNITYENFLSFKNQITDFDDKLIEKLNKIAEDIKSLDLNITTVYKDKFWNKRVFESSDKIITLLNILTEVNTNEIFNKIVNVNISKDDLQNVVDHIHKKCCNEYQMLNTYIIIINKIVHSGLYSYNRNLFWKKLIDNVQNTFIDEDILNNKSQFYTGNILLIFFLCKNRLLSLKVLDNIFNFFNDNHQNETVINLIFKIIDKIPIFHNNYFIDKINRFLELEIPFRIKFKFKQLLVTLDEKTFLENKLNEFIKKYKTNNNNISDLVNILKDLPNFKKALFFKLLILTVIKSDLNDKKIKSLVQFGFKKKYKPLNHKKILNAVKKELPELKKTYSSSEIIFNKIINREYI